MDFVGDDQHVVIHADPTEAPQLIRGPDPADGIVRAAQNGQFYRGIGTFCYQVFEIHVVPAILIP